MGGTKGKNIRQNTMTDSQIKANKKLMKGSGGILEQAYGGIGKYGNVMDSPMYQQGLQHIQNIISQYSPENINKTFDTQVGDPSRQAFDQQTVPALLESMIAGGAGRSGAAQQQLSQAGQGLEANLASQRGAFQQQGLQNQMAAINQGLEYQQSPINQLLAIAAEGRGGVTSAVGQKQFENVYRPPTQSPLMPLLSAGLTVASGGLGAGAMGALGGMAGVGGAGAGFQGGINSFLGR